MSMIKRCWIFIVIVCLFFVASSSFAQGPDSRPRGWDKGKKSGWNSDIPRGLEKKSESNNDSDSNDNGSSDETSDDDSSGDEVSSDDGSSDEASGDNDKKRDKKKKKKHKKKKKKK
jgi:hypothetical protein